MAVVFLIPLFLKKRPNKNMRHHIICGNVRWWHWGRPIPRTKNRKRELLFIFAHLYVQRSWREHCEACIRPSVQLNWKDRKHPPSVIPPLIALHYEECKKHVLRNEVRCYEIRLLLHFLVESVCPRVIFPLLHPQHHIINYKLTCSHANRRACTAWRKQKN